jgi:hypothetical protein
VVKLVDAGDSKSPVRKDMSVRFRPPAPKYYHFIYPLEICISQNKILAGES